MRDPKKMPDDIRAAAKYLHGDGYSKTFLRLLADAADEIERLRVEAKQDEADIEDLHNLLNDETEAYSQLQAENARLESRVEALDELLADSESEAKSHADAAQNYARELAELARTNNTPEAE